MSDELAIDILLAAAQRLPLEACQQLAEAITRHLVLVQQNQAYDLSPNQPRRDRVIAALHEAAGAIGHAPNSSEYQAEYRRRRASGDSELPSAPTILRAFGSWAEALGAAGLIPATASTPFRRRSAYVRRNIRRYSDERMRECLLACKQELRRVPTVRDYVVWRAELLSRPRGMYLPAPDIPHYRTFYNRHGSWGQALAAVGLPGDEASRCETTEYPALPPRYALKSD